MLSREETQVDRAAMCISTVAYQRSIALVLWATVAPKISQLYPRISNRFGRRPLTLKNTNDVDIIKVLNYKVKRKKHFKSMKSDVKQL